MTIVPVMWGVWGLLALITAAVYVYRSRLTRDEEDQIFLSEGFEHEKAHQINVAQCFGIIEYRAFGDQRGKTLHIACFDQGARGGHQFVRQFD